MNYVKAQSLKTIVKNTLREDIGERDITTKLVIPKDKNAEAILLAKEPCVVCGLAVAALVFKSFDKKIKFKAQVSDGASVKKGRVLARISGRAAGILGAERVALNFLCLLSGTATATKKFVEAIRPYKAKIIDTRKTIPGLRVLQKYAVRIGGGYNHRLSLDEMVLVKDNHIKAIKGYCEIKAGAGSFKAKGYRVELEVGDLREFKTALKLKPDMIMLDNMNIKEMRKAVLIRNSLSVAASRKTLKLEASGGVSLKNARSIAATGVDMISIGALTHSVNSVDISLEIL